MNPLEAFLYKEGFARLSTERFSLEPEDLKKQFIHLTNVAVQKNNMIPNLPFPELSLIGGTKLSLKMLRQRIIDKGYSFDSIWQQINEIIVKSLLASEIPNNPNCFELFGYDIMIDDNGKCWLLEINSSPSLSRDTVLDDLVKQQLIDDIVDLVDPVYYDRMRLIQVLERRIKEERGCKSLIHSKNNSKEQLNKDISYILHNQIIRKIGDLPKNMGNFERIAPTEFSEKIIKMLQGFTLSTKRFTSLRDSDVPA